MLIYPAVPGPPGCPAAGGRHWKKTRAPHPAAQHHFHTETPLYFSPFSSLLRTVPSPVCTAGVPWTAYEVSQLCQPALQLTCLNFLSCHCCFVVSDSFVTPMNYSPPGPSVHGIPQARILEWVAMPSSRGSSRPRDETACLTSPALAGRFFTPSAAWEAWRVSHIAGKCMTWGVTQRDLSSICLSPSLPLPHTFLF